MEVDDGRRKMEDGRRKTESGRVGARHYVRDRVVSLARELAGWAACLCRWFGPLACMRSRSFGLTPAAQLILRETSVDTDPHALAPARACVSLSISPAGCGARRGVGVVRDLIAVSGVSGGSDRASCKYI